MYLIQPREFERLRHIKQLYNVSGVCWDAWQYKKGFFHTIIQKLLKQICRAHMIKITTGHVRKKKFSKNTPSPKELYVCIGRLSMFNATFNNISVISGRSVLFDEGNQSTRRKQPTCRKSLTNFISYSNKTSFFRFVKNERFIDWV